MSHLAYAYEEVLLKDEDEMQTQELVQNYLLEYVNFLSEDYVTEYYDDFFGEKESEALAQTIQI